MITKGIDIIVLVYKHYYILNVLQHGHYYNDVYAYIYIYIYYPVVHRVYVLDPRVRKAGPSRANTPNVVVDFAVTSSFMKATPIRV